MTFEPLPCLKHGDAQLNRLRIGFTLLAAAGWFSVLGEVALVGAAAASMVTLFASLMQVNFDYILTPAQQLGIYAGIPHNAKAQTLCAPYGPVLILPAHLNQFSVC